MTAVRTSPDDPSTSHILRPMRWEWLEGVSQRSGLTSSNNWWKRVGRNSGGYCAEPSPWIGRNTLRYSALRAKLLGEQIIVDHVLLTKFGARSTIWKDINETHLPDHPNRESPGLKSTSWRKLILDGDVDNQPMS